MEQLPGATRRLRDGALFMVNNIEAVQWALELYGFKDVSIKVSHLQVFIPISMFRVCGSDSRPFGYCVAVRGPMSPSQACGVQVAASQQTKRAAEVPPGDEQLEELFKTPTPLLCNVAFSINLSL